MQLVRMAEDEHSKQEIIEGLKNARRRLGCGARCPYPIWFREKIIAALNKGCSLASVCDAAKVTAVTVSNWRRKDPTSGEQKSMFRTVGVAPVQELTHHVNENIPRTKGTVSVFWGKARIEMAEESSAHLIANMLRALEGHS